MRKQLNAASVFGMGIVLCMVLGGCSGENGNPSEASGLESLAALVENRAEVTGQAEAGKETEDGKEAKNSKEAESSEGQFYDGANLSGRIMDFSDTGFQITPETLIIYEDGSMGGGVAAPGYEKEEDFISIAYTDDTVFQIVYFSRSAQAEVSREDTDKSSIQKDMDVNIFGSCQDEKHWTADKVVITRWQ